MENDHDLNRDSDDENEDEEMDDVNEPEQDVDQDIDAGGDDEDEDDGGDEDDDQNDDEDDDDQNEPDSPSRRPSQHTASRRAGSVDDSGNAAALTSPSPRAQGARSPGARSTSFAIPVRPIALTALAYDIVPTMAAPQSTSINAIASTPDMRWVFTGGADGYVRMFNWIDTANGRVPLTVAQKHPFVDSVWKAGSLVTYWENEDYTLRTPPTQGDETKEVSPVYSLAVHRQALWLLSGLESGCINLQTCRHSAGTLITTLKEHTSAVSVLTLSQDETSVLSGSWDKNIHDWCLNTGQTKRSFKGAGGQISAIETRPLSNVQIPEVSNPFPETSDTLSSDNANAPRANGSMANGIGGVGTQNAEGEEDAMGSPEGSLFGETSLFGEETGGGGGGANVFDDDDDLARALESEMQDNEQDAPGEADTEMTGMGSGGPVQPPETAVPDTEQVASDSMTAPEETTDPKSPNAAPNRPSEILTNGLPHSDEPLTAPPTNEDQKSSSADLVPESESTFLDAAIEGTIRIWDRRVQAPIATILPFGSTPPWSTGACWSPDGNSFYVGRRNNTVDEYSIHHLGSKRSEPNRTFKFQHGSGPVYAVRAMPNKKHLVCASNDILRIYDLAQAESRHRTVPFTIVPGHRGGVISAIHVDPACRFMLSSAGNRGWGGEGTEVLLGYEIGVQDEKGEWHK